MHQKITLCIRITWELIKNYRFWSVSQRAEVSIMANKLPWWFWSTETAVTFQVPQRQHLEKGVLERERICLGSQWAKAGPVRELRFLDSPRGLNILPYPGYLTNQGHEGKLSEHELCSVHCCIPSKWNGECLAQRRGLIQFVEWIDNWYSWLKNSGFFLWFQTKVIYTNTSSIVISGNKTWFQIPALALSSCVTMSK